MQRVFAPGRVNLIGDHTDYAGGRALPMAIDLGITVEYEPDGDVLLWSDEQPEPARVPLEVADPAAVSPPWARYVAGVVAELRPPRGVRGRITSTLPAGVGLSSSAALEVAVALALGAGESHDVLALAQLCRRAETRGSGVPCGLMDQLTCLAGVEGHALAIDFGSLTWEPVALPDEAGVWVVPSGVERALASSAYAERRATVERAAAEVGPLAAATSGAVAAIRDPEVRRRARHVVTECARVDAMVGALRAGDLRSAGSLLAASHASLRDDFGVSLPVIDALVDRLADVPGVYGARLTGAGFGGAVVALTTPAADLAPLGGRRVRPSGGAHPLRSGGASSRHA